MKIKSGRSLDVKGLLSTTHCGIGEGVLVAVVLSVALVSLNVVVDDGMVVVEEIISFSVVVAIVVMSVDGAGCKKLRNNDETILAPDNEPSLSYE